MLAGEELVFRGPYEWLGPKEMTIYGSGWLNEPGVYLWAVDVGGVFTPYYVGETNRSFADSFLQHTRAYMTGEYSVWDPEEFLQKRKVEVWGGLWRPERRGMYPDFLADFERITARTTALLKSFRILIAPYRGSERLRERAAAAIIRAIRTSDPHPLLDENVRFRPRMPAESAVTFDLVWPVPVDGVPARIQV